MPRSKRVKVVPEVLKELLEVELRAASCGRNHDGSCRKVIITRDRFTSDGNEFEMRVIRIVKPAGVTMQQYIANGGKGLPSEEKSVSLQNTEAMAANDEVLAPVDTSELEVAAVEEAMSPEDLGVDSIIGQTPVEAKSIMDMNYSELKQEATDRGLTFKGNIAKSKLIDMLIN